MPTSLPAVGQFTDPSISQLAFQSALAQLLTHLSGQDAVLAAVQLGQAGGLLGFSSKAAMDADLAHPAGTVAYVTNDASTANNGIYLKSGASGAGSWTLSSSLSTFDVIVYAISAIRAYSRASDNLYDPALATASSALNASGAVVTLSGYFVTGMIPVAPGASIVCNMQIVQNVTYQAWWYDARGAALSNCGTSNITAGTPLTPPSNARYFRTHIAGVPSAALHICYGSALPAYAGFGALDPMTESSRFLARLNSILPGLNLFNPATVTAGNLINNAGSVSASANLFVTDYLPVIPGGQIILSIGTASVNNSGYGLVWYDSGNGYLGFTDSPILQNSAYTAPANACYVRFCCPNAYLGTLAVYLGTSVPATWRATGYTDNVNLLGALAAVQAFFALAGGVAGSNLYNPDLRVNGKAILAASGAETSLAGFFATHYMPVAGAGTAVTNGVAGNSSYGVAFYDAGKTFISSIAAPITSGAAITVPARACYARAYGALASNAESFYFGIGSTLPAAGAIRSVPHELQLLKKWNGTSFVATGDSLTVGGNSGGATNIWCDELNAFLGGSYTKNAVAGQKYSDMLASITSGLLTSASVALVLLGTNDFTYSRALGAHGDAANAGTFYGDVRAMIDAHYTAKPSIRLGILTPPWRTDAATPNTAGHVLLDYVSAIQTVCADYGVPVLDLYRTCGITAVNSTTYLADVVHLNQAGYARVQNMINRFADGL